MDRLPKLPSRTEITRPFKSKEAFVRSLQVSEGDENGDAFRASRWSNKDLVPTDKKNRSWTWYNLPLYWFSNQFSLTGWNTGSSLVAVGLTWQQSFISCVIGSLLASIVVVCMARPGVKYHVGYPVLCRTSMGMYGSYFFIFIRAAVCIIWFGIQTYYGASILSVMFRCIFGSKWENFHNTLAINADISSKVLLAFFIVWLLEFPFMWVHPRHIHYIFTVKGFTMPIAAFAIFGWCLANGGGISSMDIASKAGSSVATSSSLGWSVMSGINVIMGGLSPMLVNQPDLARYCQKPGDAGILQGISLFISSVVVFFLGIASTTSIQAIWGVAYWNIWDLLDVILDHHWNAGARTGIFFIASAFLLGVFATNFGANTIPFGSDMTGLFPRWLSIRRGQILCSFLGIAIVPWKLIANAQSFLSFLGSYNIFMAPLCAIILVDYAFVRKGNIHIPSCYNGMKGGLYYFWYGVNWVAVIAWISGTSMGIPGLIGQYQPAIISNAAQNMYKMGWILTFVTAGVVYYIGSRFVTYPVFPKGRESTIMQWEWLANEDREGFFEGENYGTGELDGISVSSVTEAERLRISDKSFSGLV